MAEPAPLQIKPVAFILNDVTVSWPDVQPEWIAEGGVWPEIKPGTARDGPERVRAAVTIAARP